MLGKSRVRSDPAVHAASSPPSANKHCKKLKRLKQAKKHVKKWEGKQETWETKCSPSAPF